MKIGKTILVIGILAGIGYAGYQGYKYIALKRKLNV